VPYTVPSLDELIAQALTRWRNQTFRKTDGTLAQVDTAQGGLIYVKTAAWEADIWGLHKHLGYIAEQIFPDTADSPNLEHHCYEWGLTRRYGETDAELLARLLFQLRYPPAGVTSTTTSGGPWRSMTYRSRTCSPIRRLLRASGPGLGTVDVLILANAETTGSEVPSSSARIGGATAIPAGKRQDSAATFATGTAVLVGAIVENPLRGTQTTVTAVDNDTQLSLADDLFKYVNEPYIVHQHCGATTGLSTGKLVDSAAAFTDATYTVRPRDVVLNLTDGTETTVTSVDSASEITLADDIFTASGKAYVIKGLVARVKANIDANRPVTASRVTVSAPTHPGAGGGDDADRLGRQQDPGGRRRHRIVERLRAGPEALRREARQHRDISNGADDCTVATPSANVAPTTHQMIRPGSIDVA
jgi:hypothetical protein